MVRTGSVTAAAQKLKVTQPSVSAALSSLSRELEVDLTEPVGRSVRPSAGGEAFAPYAADVIGLLDQGTRAAREAAGYATQELRISAVTTAGEYIVPPLVQAFSAAHSEIGISLEVANRQDVIQQVLDHGADIAIAEHVPGNERVSSTSFLKNDLILIASSDDPLTQFRSVRVDELANRVWLLREEGSGTRELAERFLSQHGLQPKTLTLGSNAAIKSAAGAGLGISIQSSVAVGTEFGTGSLARIRPRGGLPESEWCLLRSAIGPARPPAEAFTAFVESDAARRAIEAATGMAETAETLVESSNS